ncbi:MAG TPA: hypothetical protein VIT02_13870, partial [Burkholderiaceae bacterium]
MTSLELSLALLAGLAAALVLGYNLWTARTRLKRPKPSRQRSAVEAAGARTEPSLDLLAEAATEVVGEEGAPQGGDPQAGEHAWPAEAAPAGARAPAVLDPLCDCIVEFELPAPIGGARILQLARNLRRVGSKPVLVEASRRSDAEEGTAAPVPERSYDFLRVGV